MLASRISLLALCALSPFIGCSHQTKDSAPKPAPSAVQQVVAPEHVPAIEPDSRAALLDPVALRQLHDGYGLGKLVLGQEANTTRELSSTAGFGSILGQVRADLAKMRRDNPNAKVTSVMGQRAFDAGWLDSDEMNFQLVGVLNRIDRRAFYDAKCGEIRFLYRLGYTTTAGGEPMSERLPMVVNVVYAVDGDDCREVARAWQSPAELAVDELAEWATSDGPLSSERREHWRLQAVETNIQTLRWQSTAFPSLAGHVEYVLRVFHATDETLTKFEPAPLENTPDVKQLKRDKTSRDALLELLRDPKQLEAIDQGTVKLPAKFLARKARSATSRGMARVSNRPFRQLFTEGDFADVDLTRYKTISSPAALLRRLDAATCMGCHQSRSIAGFHLLGAESDTSRQYNSLFSGASPHLLGDLERRRDYTTAMASGQTPDEFRPLPETQGGAPGSEGAPCGLGDPGFASLVCEDGLSCAQLEDPEIGECQSRSQVGGACEYGTVSSHPTPNRDRVRKMKEYDCRAGEECLLNVQAAPQGLCMGSCDDSDPNSVCADFLNIDPFQKCLRRGKSYADCNERWHYKASLRACDDRTPCRPDYVCADAGEGKGGCMPTYFLMQLRTDGYPLRN